MADLVRKVDTETLAGMSFPDRIKYNIGATLLEADISDITLLPLSQITTKEELLSRFPDQTIIACDFYVEGIETDKKILAPNGNLLVDFGFKDLTGKIINIDHHAPANEMYRYISSGNLAANYIRYFGSIPVNTKVVINHTDCDSIISSLIIRGHIPPDKMFEDAVIAADHTGAENDISDLLQALEPERDVEFSVRNLGLHLMGEPLESLAAELLQKRILGRKITVDAIKDGSVVRETGPVAFIHLLEGMRNEFLPSLLPEAAVILTYEKLTEEGHWVGRMRLSQNIEDDFNLFSLNIRENIDEKFGGRWNAGANNRGGGTFTPLDDYYGSVVQAYENFCSKNQ